MTPFCCFVGRRPKGFGAPMPEGFGALMPEGFDPTFSKVGAGAGCVTPQNGVFFCELFFCASISQKKSDCGACRLLGTRERAIRQHAFPRVAGKQPLRVCASLVQSRVVRREGHRHGRFGNTRFCVLRGISPYRFVRTWRKAVLCGVMGVRTPHPSRIRVPPSPTGEGKSTVRCSMKPSYG